MGPPGVGTGTAPFVPSGETHWPSAPVNEPVSETKRQKWSMGWDGMEDRHALESFGLGLFIFTLVRPTFYPLLALLADAVDAAVRDSILVTSFARPFFVAPFAGGCAVGALGGREENMMGIRRINVRNEVRCETYGHLDLSALGASVLLRRLWDERIT